MPRQLERGRGPNQREKERERNIVDRYSAVDKAITCRIPLGAPLSITWLYIIDFHISLSQSSWFWNYLPFNRSSIWHECAALVPCLSSPLPPFPLPLLFVCFRWQDLWPDQGDGLSIRQLQTGFCCPFLKNSLNWIRTTQIRVHLSPLSASLHLPLPLYAQKQPQLHKTAARPINSD